ncbi:MAG: hypothetical protein KDE51_26515, partial [Anaerolineales bacterium]|nr:hypothetical protein [Anaerolineales bacterium]
MMNLEQIGRVPTTGDNCAIATRILTAGTAVQTPTTTFNLSHNILEGHRFAIEPIAAGEPLLSWGMPFGRALRDIAPGEYICNERVLNALSGRALDFELPAAPNFEDDLAVYQFDRQTFKPAPPLPQRPDPRTFMGYQRSGGRGVGTRNMIVLLGVNALAGGFVQQLENAVRPL